MNILKVSVLPEVPLILCFTKPEYICFERVCFVERWFVRRRVKKECIDTIIGKSYVGDWFLFYLLGQNIDSVIFKVSKYVFGARAPPPPLPLMW